MIRLLVGHVLDRLAELPGESVQCCVTSPPYYWLRDYGIEPQVWDGDRECRHEWDEEGRSPTRLRNGEGSNTAKQAVPITLHPSTGAFCIRCNAWRGSLGLEPTLALYLDHLVAVCREIRRVLRKDGTFWLNIGTSYAAQPSKRGHVPQTIRRDKFSYPERATPTSPGVQASSDNVLLACDCGSCGKCFVYSVMRALRFKPKDLMDVPALLMLALQADGWYVRSEIVWAKDAAMPESVTDRPTSAHEKIFLLTKSARYFYDAEAIKEEAKCAGEMAGGNYGKERDKLISKGWVRREVPAKRNLRNVWRLPSAPFPEAHFATFPLELPRRCILAGSKPGDTILDPFAGAGTTLLAADQLQRDAVGIELNATYSQLAANRVIEDAPLLAQFML